MGKKKLMYTEEELWKLTPKKFFAMLSVAMQYDESVWGSSDKKNKNGKEKSPDVQDGYIDEIKW